MKACCRCKTRQPFSAFHKRARARDGYHSECKACRRRYNTSRDVKRRSYLKTRFGLSVEEYNALFAKQGGLCAICRTTTAERHLAVDHCHATGAIRGLLCRNCNLALGLMRDDSNLFKRAARYLNNG